MIIERIQFPLGGAEIPTRKIGEKGLEKSGYVASADADRERRNKEEHQPPPKKGDSESEIAESVSEGVTAHPAIEAASHHIDITA